MTLDPNIAEAQSASALALESYDTVSAAGLDGNFERDHTAYAQMEAQSKSFRRLNKDPVYHVELPPHDEQSKAMPAEVFVILSIIGLSYVNAAWFFNII